METVEIQRSDSPSTARIPTPLWVLVGVSAGILALTGVFAGPRFGEIFGYYRESSAAHSRVDSLSKERDQLLERIEELKASPEMAQHAEDLQKATDFCSQGGLGELPAGLIEQAIRVADMSETTEREAQRLCPNKLALLDLTNDLVDSLREGMEFSCTSTGDIMTISGTLRYTAQPGFPEGVPNNLIDFRLEGSTVEGEDTINSKLIDVTGVAADTAHPFEIRVPITAGNPDMCSIRVDSWWPSGY